MYVNPFQVSLETLIGTSPLLGHALEARTGVREAQEPSIVRAVQQVSTVPLGHFSQQNLFTVAPLDILVERVDGRAQFHIIELNGTGIGGLTNLSGAAVSAILDGFARFAETMTARDPVVLVASSGLEAAQSPRKNRLIHEKILYAEALCRGFAGRGQSAAVTTMPQVAADEKMPEGGRPIIVLGYMKEFLQHLHTDRQGRLLLLGQPVAALINDRFALNVVQQFGEALDLNRLLILNRSFWAGADKSVAYDLLNDYLDHKPNPISRPAHFSRADNRDQLIDTVLRWARQGNRALIKPQGTGLGHGIEFFLSPTESAESITARIDASLQLTEQYYGITGGALPYTVCGFIDTCTIQRPGHALHGRKYELRIVVYRDGLMLRAFPSIAKVASEVYCPDHPTQRSLINNITNSVAVTHSPGTEHMLPLASRQTLELLGLSVEDLRQVSALATGYVRYVLDQVQTAPARLGLPAASNSVASAIL
jgi:hypothetical protein